MRRALAAGAALLAALALGCGGEDSLSAEEYAAELDAICQDSQEFFVDLPARVGEEDLSAEEIRTLAEEKDEETQRAIAALEPPDELTDTQDELVSLGEPPQDPSDPATLAYFEQTRELFETTGAERCVEIQEGTIEQLSEAPNP